MLSKQVLAETPEFRLQDIRCGAGRSGWSPPEETGEYAIVFVRRGCFRRRVGSREMLLDPAVVYVEQPGQEQRVAHPCDGGDSCTQLSVSEELLLSVLHDRRALPEGPVRTTPELDLDHRLLVGAAWRATDAFELDERVSALLGGIFGAREPIGAQDSRRAAVVDAARAAIVDDPRIGLASLARRVAYSPHHLSRLFRSVTGETMSCYRSRVRVRIALERLADGERPLSRVAADVGFADHAHLTREIRRQTGMTPSALRALLGPA